MSVPILEAIADAIYLYEGNKARDRAYRNRNPGNLRVSAGDQKVDEKGYRVFSNFTSGYNALLHDLSTKIAGMGKSGLNMDSSLLRLFQVYAPAADGNNPEKYAEHVAFWLRSVYQEQTINTATTFRALYQIARQEGPGGVSTS